MMPSLTKLSARRDPDIAHHRQVAAGTHRWPVHRGDDRDIEGVDGAWDPLDAFAIGVRLVERIAREQALAIPHVLDVAAGAESAACAGQNHRAHRGIVVDFRTGLLEIVELLGAGQRVAGVRARHGEGQHVIVPFALEKAHGTHSRL
jgi:hypothetical protein